MEAVLIFCLLGYLILPTVRPNYIQPQSVEVRATIPAYYWKDFNGLVPKNAVAGGKDENGAATYVGQFSTAAEYNIKKAQVHTIPAVIYAGSKIAVAAYAGRAINSTDSSNTKVLCYDYESSFKWFSPSSLFPSNCRFVIAGNEDGFPMYVGKANHNKEVVMGKLFSDNTNHRAGLISPYRGIEVFHEEYEVLTYCN